MRVTHYIKADRILLFDTSNLSYVSYHSHKQSMPENGHVYGFFERVYEMIAKSGWESVGLVFALDGYPKRKKDLYPDYKANREKRDFDPKPDIYKMLRYMNCCVISNDMEEADDLIATFCNERERPVDVVSSDQDLWQLLPFENVRQYNPMKRRFVTTEDLYEKYGIESWTKVPLWKAMFGDGGDNIKPAVPRVRKKLVVPMINESNGSIKDFYRIVERDKDKFTPSMFENMTNGRDKLIENGKLVALDLQCDYNVIYNKGNRKFLDVYLKRFGLSHFTNLTGLFSGEEQ